MKIETSDVNLARTDPQLPVDTVFDLLAAKERRYALHYLSGKIGAVPVTDILESVATQSGTHRELGALTVAFTHTHIPKLVDASVLRYDADAETLEWLPTGSPLTPYLELALPAEQTYKNH